MSEEADVIVLGLGVGGEEVAGRLAASGLNVIGVESTLVGGECPYWGCIPSKMTIRAADLLAETRRVDGMAGRAHAIPDFVPVARRIRDEATSNWDDTAAAERFISQGGRLVRGRGRLDGPGRVTVDGAEYRARRGVVVAAGAPAVIPPIPGLAETPYWTNRELLEVSDLPDSLLILGGGSVGIELAQAWSRFGVQVTIVESQDRILAREEPESSKLIGDVLADEDIEIVSGTAATEIGYRDSVFRVTVSDGRVFEAERLLVSTGRRAQLGQLGGASVGLDTTADTLEVDEYMRAGQQLWGVGDVTAHGGYTHVAMYQANIAVRDILGQSVPAADYRAVPRVTFTDPEVGAVGLTEKQARDRGLAVACGTAQVSATARGWIYGPGNAGYIKLVADTTSGLLVGATAAGPWGGEVLGALVVAIHARVPVSGLRSMIYAFPTFHRGIEDALHDLELGDSHEESQLVKRRVAVLLREPAEVVAPRWNRGSGSQVLDDSRFGVPLGVFVWHVFTLPQRTPPHRWCAVSATRN